MFHFLYVGHHTQASPVEDTALNYQDRNVLVSSNLVPRHHPPHIYIRSIVSYSLACISSYLIYELRNWRVWRVLLSTLSFLVV